MLSGPWDNVGGAPASWLATPSLTATNAFYGLTHERESQHAGHLADWKALGLDAFGAPVKLEASSPPFAKTRQLVMTTPPPNG